MLILKATDIMRGMYQFMFWQGKHHLAFWNVATDQSESFLEDLT